MVPIAIRRWWGTAVITAILVGLAGFGIVLSVSAFRIYRQNAGVDTHELRNWPEPLRGDRILVFAPHCDDETLGVSGVIQRAVRAGADVRVVFMTNGDGFPYAVQRQYRRLRPRPADYIRFGKVRQREAVAALHTMGVRPEQIVFLGYPDRGLAELWLNHWNPWNAYVSFSTGHSRSPYEDSYTPQAVYCGRSVLSDVQRLFRDFQPTVVYCPHPSDNHSDHWATYTFVTLAVSGQYNPGALGAIPRQSPYPCAVGLYLVHRGDWPVPQGEHVSRDLAPPSSLLGLDTTWSRFQLTDEEVDAKRRAIACYRSQLRVMKRFLTSFHRRAELIGTRGTAELREAPAGIVVDGFDRDWQNLPVSIPDPREDSLPVDVGGSADITSLRACRDNKRLCFLLTTRKPLNKAVAYRIYWRGDPDDTGKTRSITLKNRKATAANAISDQEGAVWEASVPLPDTPYVFIGADTRYRGYVVDKVGWKLLVN
jgi:LmbE family N-acetylglucosaminyl deacetylase